MAEVVTLTQREEKVFWILVKFCSDSKEGRLYFRGSKRDVPNLTSKGISLGAISNLSKKGLINVATVTTYGWDSFQSEHDGVFTFVEISRLGHLWMYGNE